MALKVAIVGGSPLTWKLAPFEDSEWEIWVLGNQINRYEGKRVTRIFEVHDNLSQHGDVVAYVRLLESQGKPLVVGPKFPGQGEQFPYEQAKTLMGGDYLSSSPAYMMAYALLKGATDIGIYGVEMAVDDHEYFKQRPAMYAWIAYAKGRGINVHIPPESSLFKEMYVEGRDWNNDTQGIAPFTASQFAEMKAMHLGRIDELNDQIAALQNRVHTHNGAAQAYDRLMKVARAVEGGAELKTLTESAALK